LAWNDCLVTGVHLTITSMCVRIISSVMGITDESDPLKDSHKYHST
jgi:hypothetical protein